jgi:hypothetical protein
MATWRSTANWRPPDVSPPRRRLRAGCGAVSADGTLPPRLQAWTGQSMRRSGKHHPPRTARSTDILVRLFAESVAAYAKAGVEVIRFLGTLTMFIHRHFPEKQRQITTPDGRVLSGVISLWFS